MTYAKRMPTVRWFAPALAVIVLAFLAFSLPPYFAGGTRVPATFTLHYPLLVAHVMLASVAMVTAVAQIWPQFAAHRPMLHRRIGRAYVVTAISAAACALVIGAATPFGPIVAVSNVTLASLWLWSTFAGYLAARQHRFLEHRRHMLRSATLTLSIITNRVWTPVLDAALNPLQHSMFGGNEEHYVWCVAGLGAWLGWTIPILATQLWLNGRTPRLTIRG